MRVHAGGQDALDDKLPEYFLSQEHKAQVRPRWNRVGAMRRHASTARTRPGGRRRDPASWHRTGFLYRASLYDSSGPLLAAKQAEFFHGLQQAHPSFHFMSSRWFSRGRNSSHCGRSVSGDANPNGTSLYLRKSAHVSQAGLNKDAKSGQKQHHATLYIIENNGEPGGARTRDHRIKSANRPLLRTPRDVLFFSSLVA